MHSITLISTVHEEMGLCNACKLHQLLEGVQPDVIFLEIPRPNFDEFFKIMNRSNLESKAVHLYLERRASILVPVDEFEVPDDFHVENERLDRRVTRVSPDYRNLMDWNSQQIEQVGFAYLNSKSCIELWSSVDRSVKDAIEYMGQEQELMPIYERWRAVIEHREEAMMKNIQNYSQENKFNKGVFLLGAAHRGAIIEKAGNPSLGNSVTLNWNFENYKGLI